MPATSRSGAPRAPRRQSAVLVGLTAVLLAVGVACGGGGTSSVLKGDPTALVRQAADRTIAAHTAQVAVTVGVAVGPGLVGTGVVDFPLGQAQLTFQRTGSGAKTGDRFELVVDGANGYLGGVLPPVGSAPNYLRGALPDVAQTVRARVSPLDDLMVRPGAGMVLAFLRGAQKVLPYGGEEVQGASTMRYSFVIDLASAEAAATPDERSALATAAQAIGDVQEPADVWLDAAGRVRRLQFATDPKLHTTTTKPNLFFTEDGEYLSFIVIDFSKFGSPAPVTIPVLPGT